MRTNLINNSLAYECKMYWYKKGKQLPYFFSNYYFQRSFLLDFLLPNIYRLCGKLPLLSFEYFVYGSKIQNDELSK